MIRPRKISRGFSQIQADKFEVHIHAETSTSGDP